MVQKAKAGVAKFDYASFLPLCLLCVAAAAVLLSYSSLNMAHFALPQFVYGTTAVLAAASALFYFSLKGDRQLLSSSMDAPVLGMLGAVAITTIFSTDPFLSRVGLYKFYGYGFTAMAAYALFFVTASQLHKESETKLLFRVLILCGAVAGIYSVLQGFGFNTFPGISMTDVGRSVSLYGNPVYSVAVFVLVLPLALAEIENKKADKRIFILAAFVIIAGLYFTKSRGGWLSGAVGISSYIWLSGKFEVLSVRRRRSLLGVFAILGLVGLAALFAVKGKKQSDIGRIELWRSSISVFQSRPLIGVGPAAFENTMRSVRSDGFVRVMGASTVQAHAHNDFLESLSTTGLLGFGVYLWLLFSLAVCARTALKGTRRQEAAGYVAGLVALFVQAKINPIPFPAIAVAAIIVGLLASLSRGSSKRKTPFRNIISFACLILITTALCADLWRYHRADRSALKATISDYFKDYRSTEFHYRVAVSENPRETQYRMDLLNFFFDRLKEEKDLDRKRKILLEALDYADEGVMLRPVHPDSLQMLGLANIRLGEAGDPSGFERAAVSLDRALELDARFPILLRMRGVVAEKTGDVEKVQEMRNRLNALRRQ